MQGGRKERLYRRKTVSGPRSVTVREEIKIFREYNRKEFVFLREKTHSQPR